MSSSRRSKIETVAERIFKPVEKLLEDLAEKSQRVVSMVTAVTFGDQRGTVMLKDVELIRELYGITQTEDLKLMPESQIRALFDRERDDLRIQEGVLSQVSVLISAFVNREVPLTVPITTDESEQDVNFSTYIRKVLKVISPDSGITADGLQKVNKLLISYGAKLVKASVALANLSGAKTISSRQVQAATRIVLPGKLQQHAVTTLTKVVTKYSSNKQGRTGGKRMSAAETAGLSFAPPVARAMIANAWTQRISEGAPVALAAVLEYLCAEVLELSSNMTKMQKKSRITDVFVDRAVRFDEELDQM